MANNLINVRNGSQMITLTEEMILDNVNNFVKGLELPKTYDHIRAAKSFGLALANVNGIEKVSLSSVYQALNEYINKNYDISKNQCALIVYGDKLKLQRQYKGTKALAKQVDKTIVDIYSSVIYKGDVVNIKKVMGRTIVNHETKFENIKDSNVVGAYATVVRNVNGKLEEDNEIMTMEQIAQSWSMSKAGNNVHKKFPTQMSRKTVLNKLCGDIVDSSPNKPLDDDFEYELDDEEKELNEVVNDLSNDDVFDMNEFENNNVVEETPINNFVEEQPQVEVVEDEPQVVEEQPQVQERDCTKCVICGKTLNQQNVEYYKAHPEKEVICYSCNLARKGK